MKKHYPASVKSDDQWFPKHQELKYFPNIVRPFDSTAEYEKQIFQNKVSLHSVCHE